ncbi:hypothetical protein LB545_07525 [Mesorhizobium sp. BR1-1-6]|uniref:hypothetical protein n=1 Tax=Mesorhizobium sp. BR1-1-6 TaxID=2876648 RepID=UPI001CD0F733|nr:hypothetical protein [Mesorhizobium sp. BR1-1-6]MBZ9894192.1 hypothetical protein [Mesorhizobium sp. BR1-1-6]
MTIERIEKELREGLARASKGRWKHFRRNGVNEVQHGRSNVPVVAWAGFDDSSRAEEDHAANAAYIVAAQPDNIRALLSEIERLREALKPFAMENDIDPALPDDTWLGVKHEDVFVAHCHARDFRRASRALTIPSEKEGGDHG